MSSTLVTMTCDDNVYREGAMSESRRISFPLKVYESRNVRRDRNDVSAKARVTRPGGFGVIDPGIKNCDEGQND